MGQMTVKINGYAYTVGCQDGEEAHLQAMVQQVEERVARMKAMGSQSGESRLLLQAALLMADELHDLQAEMAGLRQAKPASSPASPPPSSDDMAMRRQLSVLASRAEDIAAELERH